MFGRATITLGIGPHSSFFYFAGTAGVVVEENIWGHLGAMPTQAESSTECGRIETPKASNRVGNDEGCPLRRGGVSPPQPTRRFGEHRDQFPQRGPGQSPGLKSILAYFEALIFVPIC